MNHFPSMMAFVGELHREKAVKGYEKALVKMQSEVKRAQAKVAMLKMLYKELQEQQKKEKIKA